MRHGAGTGIEVALILGRRDDDTDDACCGHEACGSGGSLPDPDGNFLTPGGEAAARDVVEVEVAGQVQGGGDPGKERSMLAIMKKLVRDEKGQDLAEYAIALAVITLAVIAAVQLVGTRVTTLWNQAATTLQNAAS